MAKSSIVTTSVLAGIACSIALLSAGCQKKSAPETSTVASGAEAAPAAKKALTIWWAQWAPADGLQDLAKEFAAKENVDVTVHQIPWANFQDQVFQEFGKNHTAFDVVVGDSQWLGRGATKGLYVDLSSWLPSAVEISFLPNIAMLGCR